MNLDELEVALSVVMVEWAAERYPSKDSDTTILEELGSSDRGILLTVGDEEFRILIEDVE